MKLDKEEKKKIIIRRLKIEEILKEVPEGTRIHIPKKELEELLFDEIIYDDALQTPLRIPAWSGDFLSKIDFKEISFENVSWAINSADEWQCYAYEECEERMPEPSLSSETEDMLFHYIKEHEKIGPKKVIYSKTNAYIDFKKSYEYKKYGEIMIFSCDFSGTDLSKNDMNAPIQIRNSDLSKTKIKFIPLKEYSMKSREKREYDEKKKKSKGYIWIFDTNLEEVDLSSFEVDFMSEINMGLCSCNLRNTGIRINNLNKGSIRKARKTYYEDITVETIAQKFKDGEYDGCYVNGTLVKPSDERKKSAQEKKAEYLRLRDALTESIVTDIRQQIDEINRNRQQ